ncbi:MAG TPA: kelch repeat-containing protein [Pyrinomonadaceae bacterium]
MTKRNLFASLLGTVLIGSAAYAQSARPGAPAPAKPAAPQALAAPPLAAGLYAWQVRPDDIDGYFSSNIPQPVCGMEQGVWKIFIFTNFDYYPSKNFHNYSNAVRVGVITTPADTYQLRSSNVSGDAHTLPGARQEFAATSIVKAGETEHTLYLFGGRNMSGELGDVYSYTPAGGFKFEANIPVLNGVPGGRSGAVAVPSKGKIYLFGGRQGNAVLNQVVAFDPQTKQFAVAASLPTPFYGARGMTKAVGNNNYIYLVGGKDVSGGGQNGKVYRYDVLNAHVITVKAANSLPNDLVIPTPGYPMATWDPSGNVRIIAAGANGASGVWTWGNIEAWILKDNYGGANDGQATLIPAPYNNPARARDMAGAVKCGNSTYLVGGTYGHGKTFQNRGNLVDRLGGLTYGPVKTVSTQTLNDLRQ